MINNRTLKLVLGVSLQYIKRVIWRADTGCSPQRHPCRSQQHPVRARFRLVESCPLAPSGLVDTHTCSTRCCSYRTWDNSRMSAVVCDMATFSSGLGAGNLYDISSSRKDECVSYSAPCYPKSKGWRYAWGLATVWRREIKASDQVYAGNQFVERSRLGFWFNTLFSWPSPLYHAMGGSCVHWRK
jgi:hypothetical protein